MDAADGFLLSDTADVHDPHEPLSVGGACGAQMFDLDGDGILDTRVTQTEAGVTVASDVDGDGVMDKFTAFRRDGAYESWEIFRETEGSARWNRTGFGEL